MGENPVASYQNDAVKTVFDKVYKGTGETAGKEPIHDAIFRGHRALTAVARGVIEEAQVRDRVAQHSNVVRLQGVSRRFGQTQALRNVSLTVQKAKSLA